MLLFWLTGCLFLSFIVAQSDDILVLIENIESWSNPEYIKVDFKIRNGTSEAQRLVDNSYNYTRKFTNLYSHISIYSIHMDKPDVKSKILESTTDMCKLFEGKERDAYLNFMFNVIFTTFGKTIKKCPIEKNSYYEYKNINLGTVPIPFGKYFIAESDTYFNWQYQVREHKKFKTFMNVTVYAKLRRPGNLRRIIKFSKQ